MTQRADVDEQAVVRGYREGRSLRELAEEHEVSVQPIRRILREHGIPIGRHRGPDKAPRPKRAGARGLGKQRTRQFTEAELEDMAARFIDGETQIALARRFGCSASTVGRALRAAGIAAGQHGQLREHHHAWKGGRTYHGSGYAMVRAAPGDEIAQAMKVANGYVLEHRLVMAHQLGRALRPEESVHHVNGDRRDNRPENLQLRRPFHGKGATFRCRSCGSTDIEEVPL